jgi:hypothetical protein
LCTIVLNTFMYNYLYFGCINSFLLLDLLDLDPDPGDQSNADPDPKHWVLYQ